MASKDNILSTLATALRLVKATPEEALRDIEVIDSIVDGVTPDDKVPGKTELLTIGPPTAARGLQAELDIKRNSDLQPQQDVTLSYQELDGRMSDMQKSLGKAVSTINALVNTVNSLTSALKKAEDKKEEMKQDDKDADEATEKAHRKARIAVRKAESSDEEEADMIMDSAEKAIKAFDAAISKAEDDAESDEDEKKTEKARADLKTLRASMKALRDSKAAEKAKTVAAPAVKAEEKEEKKDEADDMLKSLLAQKGITVNELISQIQGATIRSAPTFSKAIQSNSDILMTNIDAAFDEGRITQGEYQSAMQILSQKALLSSGALTESQFGQAFDRAPSTVKQLFVPATV